MSITVAYEVEPAVLGGANPENGDTSQLQQITDIARDPITDISFYVGSSVNASFDEPKQGFWRFEVDVPEGSKILGVQFDATSGSPNSGANGPIPMYGGFLKQQNQPYGWEGSQGVGEWTLDSHVPLVDFNTLGGLDHREDRFWGDARAYAQQNHTNAATGEEWSIGEGTAIGTAATVTGLIAQLESYLAGNEGTRGSTKADCIPTMFTVLRNAVGPSNQFQFLTASDSIVPSFRPKLRVEYEPPPATELASSAALDAAGTVVSPSSTAELVSSAALDANGTVVSLAETELIASTSIDLRPFLGAAGSLNVFSASTLDASLHAIFRGGADIVSNSVLDALGFFNLRGRAEATSQSLLDAVSIVFRIGVVRDVLISLQALDVLRNLNASDVRLTNPPHDVAVGSSTAIVSRNQDTHDVVEKPNTIIVTEE